MKIIEAMKEIKRLEEKMNDLNTAVQTHCADLDVETPVYPDQKSKVSEWLQSAHDSLKEAMRLRIAIQNTNLKTMVTIELGKTAVTHSIAEWIIRRRLYSKAEMTIWSRLGDKGLKEGRFKNSSGSDIDVKIRRYFDPIQRDNKIEEYRSEPNIIDRTLEVVNATTELI